MLQNTQFSDGPLIGGSPNQCPTRVKFLSTTKMKSRIGYESDLQTRLSSIPGTKLEGLPVTLPIQGHGASTTQLILTSASS